MTNRKRLAAIALTGAATLALGLVAAGPAAAINSVDCAGRSDFYADWNEGEVCFANNGSTVVHIVDVYAITSGNNNSVTRTIRMSDGSVQNVQLGVGGGAALPTSGVEIINITGR